MLTVRPVPRPLRQDSHPPTTPCAASRFHPFEADGPGSVPHKDPVGAEETTATREEPRWRETVSSRCEHHLYFCVYESQVLALFST